jgi:hypothetical protein
MGNKIVERQGNEPKILLPRVKFTGQQPGEEGVERDDSKDESGQHNDDLEDEEKTDERGLPVGEPSTEGKFSV